MAIVVLFGFPDASTSSSSSTSAASPFAATILGWFSCIWRFAYRTPLRLNWLCRSKRTYFFVANVLGRQLLSIQGGRSFSMISLASVFALFVASAISLHGSNCTSYWDIITFLYPIKAKETMFTCWNMDYNMRYISYCWDYRDRTFFVYALSR